MSAEPPADDPPDVVAEAIRKDPRYPRAAYAFVSEALSSAPLRAWCSRSGT